MEKTPTRLSEADIAEFCDGCDFLGNDNGCKSPLNRDAQIPNVESGICFMAQRDSALVIKTGDGFSLVEDHY